MPTSLPETPPPETPPPEPPRLPMGTRISLYYIFVVFLTLFVARPLLGFFLLSPEQKQAFLSGETQLDVGYQLAIEAALLPFVILVTILFVRLVDKKPLHTAGIVWQPGERHRVVRDLVLGLAGAAGLLGLWYLAAGFAVDFEILGAGKVVPPETAMEATAAESTAAGVAAESVVADSAAELLLIGLGFLCAAILEEWILRGYIYSTLREKLSWVHAGGIASLLFVLLQLVTPNVPAPALLNVFLLGFFLAALRELTGSLWPGAVFHGAWNFLMGSILSLPVSGNRVPAWHNVRVTGPEAWSGGAYGPEGSWLMAALLFVAVVGFAGVLSRGEESEEDDEEE